MPDDIYSGQNQRWSSPGIMNSILDDFETKLRPVSLLSYCLPTSTKGSNKNVYNVSHF
jgi:hypothetical protein